MSLKTLRTDIMNEMDYSPDLMGYKNQADDILNMAYMNIWTMKRWNFAVKEKFIKFYPDITPSRDAAVTTPPTNVTASVIKGNRKVTFSQLMDRLIPQNWEDQIIEIQGFEYLISKVVTHQEILLERPFIGTTASADITWKIKHRWYDLPQDCMELLGLSHRDTPVNNNPVYGKMIGVMSRTDEEINLRVDRVADYAEAFVWSAPLYILPAEKTSVSNITAVGALDGGFPETTYLEVCWAFEQDGHIGSLSEPATVTFPTDDNGSATYTFKINFLTWDDQVIDSYAFNTMDRKPTQYEGYRKLVFWNSNYDRTTGERLGLPCWEHFNVGGLLRNRTTWLDLVRAEDTDASVTINYLNQISPGNPRYHEYDGQHLRIRPYPRIDGWDKAVAQYAGDPDEDIPGLDQDYVREGVLRYLYKPNFMTKSTDSPEMPYEFHQLIVYKALESLYLKVGNVAMSQVYAKRLRDEIKGLEKRYIDRIDSHTVRGQWGFSDISTSWFDPNSLRKY